MGTEAAMGGDRGTRKRRITPEVALLCMFLVVVAVWAVTASGRLGPTTCGGASPAQNTSVRMSNRTCAQIDPVP